MLYVLLLGSVEATWNARLAQLLRHQIQDDKPVLSHRLANLENILEVSNALRLLFKVSFKKDDVLGSKLYLHNEDSYSIPKVSTQQGL